MDLKLYEIINLEQAIDELIKYDLSFTFKVSLDKFWIEVWWSMILD